jgi:hypothetical protein
LRRRFWSGSVIAGACIVRGGLAAATPNKAAGTQAPTTAVPGSPQSSLPNGDTKHPTDVKVPGLDFNPGSMAGREPVPGKDFNPTKVAGPWLVPGKDFDPASKH